MRFGGSGCWCVRVSRGLPRCMATRRFRGTSGSCLTLRTCGGVVSGLDVSILLRTVLVVLRGDTRTAAVGFEETPYAGRGHAAGGVLRGGGRGVAGAASKTDWAGAGCASAARLGATAGRATVASPVPGMCR